MSVLVIGSTNMDISVSVERFPAKGETLLGKEVSYKYGGKGANQACACGKLGAEVTFLTCVGNDAHGHEIVGYLGSVGVDVSKVKYSDELSTGTAVINVDANGDNTIVVIQGANLACDVEYIRSHEDCFKTCDYVLLQMEIPFDAIEEAIKLAAKYDKKVILNPAPASDTLSKDVYKYITYMTPNEVEVKVMASSNGELEENAKQLQTLGVENVLVTLGSQGAKLFTKERGEIYVPACKVNAIDTVAAGDCFNGAFVTALDRGDSEEEAMKFANQASAIAVTRKGAQESIPTIEEMNRLAK
ncbi:MAG: ribokinase [Erysipelotrichaceae bacterium]|nr:ribokinase [Erysipelotrichaceae bacterium]